MSVSHNWADRLRNLATFMVVAIHVSGPIAEQHPDFNTWDWWVSNWWDATSRAGVPIFVLLSGALLLTKDYPTGSFLRKRLSKVLIPGLFWIVFYLFNQYKNYGTPDSIGEALRRIFEGKVYYHLWFIYLIVGLYLLYPILRPWVRQARDRDYWYVFACCVGAAWGYKLVYTFFGLGFGLYWETFSNNLGYFVLGAYLIQKPLPGEPANDLLNPWPVTRKQLIYIAWGLIVVGSAITAYGTYWASMTFKAGKFHNYFYDYLTPNVGMAVVGWFLLARLMWNSRPMYAIEKEFATASFGIYLTHVIVMECWAKVGFWYGADQPIRAIPVIVGMTLISSFLMVKIIRVMPGGDRIT